MKCEICGKNPGVILRNGRRVCPACAKSDTSANVRRFSTHTFKNGAEVMRGTVTVTEIPDFSHDIAKDLVCSNCGTNFSTIEKTKKVGCSACYENFKKLIFVELKKFDKKFEV